MSNHEHDLDEEYVLKALIQFRIGEGLRDRIARDVTRRGMNKQAWLEHAVMSRIENGKPKHRVRCSASALLTNKKQIGVRLDPLVVGVMDEDCEEKGVTRTVWLLDACLEYLARK